jgi:hypothetical protein
MLFKYQRRATVFGLQPSYSVPQIILVVDVGEIDSFCAFQKFEHYFSADGKESGKVFVPVECGSKNEAEICLAVIASAQTNICSFRVDLYEIFYPPEHCFCQGILVC